MAFSPQQTVVPSQTIAGPFIPPALKPIQTVPRPIAGQNIPNEKPSPNYEKMNVFQKIIEIKKAAGKIKKNGKGYGYRYTTSEEVYNKITPKMNEIGLLFVMVSAECTKSYQYQYKNEKGEMKTDFVLEGKCRFAWVNADCPSDRHTIDGDYFGQQADISQAYGSALTYYERYALLKTLGLPTDESDPNAKPESQRPSGESKYDKVVKLTKGSKYTIEDVNKWILKTYGHAIRVNELSDEQFNTMYDALAAKVMEDGKQV